jgi:Asp-tRNA(Asn)/Glu-tRNA(Gln) amidotransferase A subunit family amidase
MAHSNDDTFRQSTDPRVNRRTTLKLTAALATTGGITELTDAQENTGMMAITDEAIAAAEKIAGLQFTDKERSMMRSAVRQNLKKFERLRALNIPNHVPPAVQFQVNYKPTTKNSKASPPPTIDDKPIPRPKSDEDLAFLPVAQLAPLIKSQKLSPVELTRIYLHRLKSIGPQLNCVVSLLEESALEEAKRAENEIKNGQYLGPLHGIPWGAKDLFATKGTATTWGAMPYKDQVIDDEATVITRLREAGAILVAKLSLGALAQGDIWFNGQTRNPWNPSRGSGGSSAGPGAATAAALVGFSIGTETLGSIVDPCTLCGITGLRPTFGRISRHGAMAVSWSMDKIGPMCRTVDDCALVFDAIHGSDPKDPTAVTEPFVWPQPVNPTELRIGFVQADFKKYARGDNERIVQAVFDAMTAAGAKLVPIELPDNSIDAIRTILGVEAAAAFDDLTRSNRDDLLVSQGPFDWPNTFRTARMVPAVEYIQAQRARTLLMRDMDTVMAEIDLFLAPSLSGQTLPITNLTGHPAVVVPCGFANGMPKSITFVGHLFDEARLLAVANLFQKSTDHHQRRPHLG